jgi:hypothetical protein
MSDTTNDKRSGSPDYRKRAEECVELAQTARTPQQRTMLLHIAETWLRLAENEVSNTTLIEEAMPGAKLNPDRTLN